MADSSGDKKHLASDRRRRQAREEGQVVKSQDLTSAALLLAALASLWMLGAPAAEAPSPPSIWPSIHPRLVELIKAHRSTMIFVNSRSES